MAGKPLIPKGSPPPLAPYSPGFAASGETIYVSGTLALDSEGKTIGVGDASAQTRAILESIKKVLAAGGSTMADVSYNMIFLKDFADYAAMNVVYKEYFPKNPPARFCIRADLVRPEFLVEIGTIAHKSGRSAAKPRAAASSRASTAKSPVRKTVKSKAAKSKPAKKPVRRTR